MRGLAIGSTTMAAALAACSGHSAKARDAAIDTAPRPDAAPDAHFGAQTVFPVDCATGTPAASFYATDGVNTTYFPGPSATIAVGDVVQFTMSITHNVGPGPGPSDTGLRVDFMETACLKFTAAGPFNFQCTTHAFYGLVTVTN